MRRTRGPILACVLAACVIPAVASAADRSSVAGLTKPSDGGTPWTTSDIAALRRRVDDAFARSAGLRGAHVGLLAVDARSGAVVYARNAEDEFIPASNAKLVTGSAALARLGPAFRFHTEAVSDGAIVAGVLQGPLVIRGGGDALLNETALDDLIAALKRQGVQRLRDAPVIDASYFDRQPYPEGWTMDDMPYDYAAVVGAASFEENVVHLTVTPARAVGERALVVASPYGRVDVPSEGCAPTIDVRVIPLATTGARGSAANLDLRRDPWGCIDVVGTIPLGAKPERLDAAVPSPAAYLRGALLAKLAAAGIAIERTSGAMAGPIGAETFGKIPAAATATTLWTHASEPLPELLADFWYPSDNLLGEVLLKALGVARSGTPGSSAAGLALETDFLRSAGVDPTTVDLYDGSGLSRYDRMTPRSLVALLRYDWRSPSRDTVLDALPVAGVRGTLAHAYVGTPSERRLFAKTGGMLDVTNLSGYLATERHGALAFSFLIGDALGDDGAIAQTRAQILGALIGG
ncbi:MAG: D-alanyl-D-alanine carboxypeptidase/D-alanyl-D-alanine-endopeptidase [Candidatus Baltobacteraceae bacterium]